MVIGFTGTRQGMTRFQVEAFSAIVVSFGAALTVFRHGGAVGSDSEAEAIVKRLSPLTWIVKFPAGTKPLERNKVIIRHCDLVIATPYEANMILRSGTWATVRYALKAGIPVKVIPPREENS